MTWTVPAAADLDPGIEPSEFYCLIAMAEKPAKTSGGILLPDDTRQREQWGSEHGRLLAISPLAFTYAAWPKPELQPQVGDVVFVGRFPGKECTGRDGKPYRLVSDREVAGIIERSRQYKWSPPDALPVAAIEKRIEALFGEVGGDIASVCTEAGEVCLVIANGEVKIEGTPSVNYTPEAIDRTIATIIQQWPDHEQRRLRWRRRPEMQVSEEGMPVLYLRLAADHISPTMEVQSAA